MENNLTIKTYMAIMAERDAAIQERNLALDERRRALADRDMAMMQRDTALAERNNALEERDKALAALELRESSMNENNLSPDSPEAGVVRGSKHLYHQQQMHNTPHLAEATTDPRGIPTSDPFVASDTAKPRKAKPTKEMGTASAKKVPKQTSGKGKRGSEDIINQVTESTSDIWDTVDFGSDGDDLEQQLVAWNENAGSKEADFDESAMPVPVCSCTGVPQPCYKWGNGGWQSACCTTTVSMYPLPQASNKRHARVGGRKMSGSAFAKLLDRVVSEGYDLSTPLDLKDHWAKHGTNRYGTLK